MKNYGQYCPIARASEIFAERWTPIIMRNVLIGCRTFTEIERGAPGIPRTVLSERLRTLARAGLLTKVPAPSGRGHVYEVTEAGAELWDVCIALGNWGARWLDVAPEHLDPGVALWSMCRRLDAERLPKGRTVVRLVFTDRPRERYWVLIEHGGAEVCRYHPGGEEDLVVTTDSATFVGWHMGREQWERARRAGRIRLEGTRELARAFPTWNQRSIFAGVAPAKRSRPRARAG